MSIPLRRPDSGGRGPIPPDEDLPAEEMRAPTEEEWAAMSPQERLEVEGRLMASDSLEQVAQREAMAEGERHLNAKVEARDTLREFFGKQRPSLFVAADIPVYYPGQKSIQPDLIAVTEVASHPRESWLVTREGKGLDFALEIHHRGSWRKDFVDNVERYAALRIREYFAFDMEERELRGWHLRPGAAVYQSMRSHWGRLSSDVLGVDLLVEEGELRFFLGNAELLGGVRLLRQLQTLADAASRRAETADQRAEAEARRAEAEARRAEEALGVLATTVLMLLAQRGIQLDEAQVAQVCTCRDLSRLSGWAARAPKVREAAELFVEPRS